jgi:hypothetical protein
MEVVYGGRCEANELKRRANVSGKCYLKSRTRRSLPSLDPHNWVDLQHHSGDKMKLDDAVLKPESYLERAASVARHLPWKWR